MEYAVLFVYFNNDCLLRQLVDLCVCMDVILFNNMTPKQINKLFAKELVQGFRVYKGLTNYSPTFIREPPFGKLKLSIIHRLLSYQGSVRKSVVKKVFFLSVS